MPNGCTLCPIECGANRAIRPGACGASLLPRVALQMLHMWEEPEISGSNGSGAVFFSGCNLSCVFCQNSDISQFRRGREYTPSELADAFLSLQNRGAHNINLVTPTIHAEALLSALPLARNRGLTIPVVYNTNAYEKVETLRLLDGLIDIYLPDLKYVSPGLALRCSGRADYFKFASAAILEMQRQTGTLKIESGIAVRGVLVRHLVLPGCADDTRRVIGWICENLGREAHVSLMSQYTPMYKAHTLPGLNRRLTPREYFRAVEYCRSLGMENVRIQELSSATSAYTPDF